MYTQHTSPGPGVVGVSLTCRCNKTGFHGDGRGWHGDGVIDPQIKHDNEPRLFFLFFSAPSSSSSSLTQSQISTRTKRT